VGSLVLLSESLLIMDCRNLSLLELYLVVLDVCHLDNQQMDGRESFMTDLDVRRMDKAVGGECL